MFSYRVIKPVTIAGVDHKVGDLIHRLEESVHDMYHHALTRVAAPVEPKPEAPKPRAVSE